MQGFSGLDDRAVSELGPWLRFAPAICAGLVALATLLGSVPLLMAVVATALLGAVVPHHPFDLLYNYGIRHLTGTGPLPPNGAPRRFACAVSTVWLSLTTWAFAAGAITVGRVLGGAFVVVAMVPVLTDFCVPSFFFQWISRCSPAMKGVSES